MKTIAVALLFFTAMTTQAKPVAIVIHAGAGILNRDSFTPERERLYHATLEQSLRAGHAILNSGGSAIDAGDRHHGGRAGVQRRQGRGLHR
jgi:beta-aspartyl-peptidase (threonine type)